jgi:hypothetical protein
MSDCRKIGPNPEDTEYILVLEQFDDYVLPFEITTGEGDDEESVDCTGAEISWTIRRRHSDVTTVKEFTIDVSEPEVGIGTASIYVDLTCGKTPEDLASQYFHHLVFIDSLGHRTTLAKGPCLINRGGQVDEV